MDKNQIMINFIMTCPRISSNPLFFNFGTIKDNANQVVVNSDDVMLQKPFIDGSVLKRYTFKIDSFKTVAYNRVIPGYADENIADVSEVQEILDWITEQSKNRNYPDFGTGYMIEDMKALSEKPELVSVNTDLTPPVAIYRTSIQIDYLDTTNKIWN